MNRDSNINDTFVKFEITDKSASGGVEDLVEDLAEAINAIGHRYYSTPCYDAFAGGRSLTSVIKRIEEANRLQEEMKENLKNAKKEYFVKYLDSPEFDENSKELDLFLKEFNIKQGGLRE